MSAVRMRRLLLLALSILGCTHGPRPRPPSVEGWREVRSTHFRLRTDLPPDAARETLEKLERLRTWLQAAWSTGGDSPGSTSAIVLDDASELWTFSHIPGIATTTRQGPIIVAAGSGSEFLLGDRSPEQQLLAHEVAHDLIRRRMPGAPRWFHEGLAGYLQTVVQLDDRRVRFGIVSVHWGSGEPRAIHQPETTVGPESPPAPVLPLDTVGTVRWEEATESELGQLYRSARFWVYLLRVEEPARMAGLEADLAAGIPWRAAWARLRQGLDIDRLGEKLWRLFQAGGWPTEIRILHPETSRAPPLTERALAPWEVHLCLAELWSLASRMPGGAGLAPHVRTEVETAVAAAPDQALPRVWLADLETDRDVRRERAESLVQRFPASPEARVFLARVLRDDGGPPEGRREAALAALTAAPDSVDALTAHAIEEVRAGNAAGAFKSVTRAEQLEPWNPAVFVARAVVLGSIGQCDQAVDAVQRALDVLPDDPPPGDVRALVQERARIARSCRPMAGP
jgi:hypothetical protein